MKDQPRDDELVVEFTGPGVEPESVDALGVLRFAAAFVDLVGVLSGSGEARPLNFTGLRVLNKCAAVAVRVDRPDRVKPYADHA